MQSNNITLFNSASLPFFFILGEGACQMGLEAQVQYIDDLCGCKTNAG